MNHKKLIIIILVLKLLTGLLLIFQLPIWFSHEPDYYNVIRFIATERQLPTRENYEDADIRQATHPPLYPLLMLPVMLSYSLGASKILQAILSWSHCPFK
ncbi:hypothetical protein ACFLYO_01985 [Chloroflexota bacterium]